MLNGTTDLADCVTALGFLLGRGDLDDGLAIARYEAAFAQVVGVRHGVSFASARVGVYGVLRALGVGEGDEVLVPLPTHIVVANAVSYTGAVPVYVDSLPGSYGMDLEAAQRLIGPRTRALILQHTFGIPNDLDAATAVAERHGLHLIEDCVHALGATYDGRPVGSFGVAGVFSTEETKTISTTMGGMVVTRDEALAARLGAFQASCAWPSRALTRRRLVKLISYHLLTEPHVHRATRWMFRRLVKRNPLPMPTDAAERRGERPPGYEQRLTNAQAALGIRQLARLSGNVAHRRWLADYYGRCLARHGFAGPAAPAKASPALVRYPIWVDQRDALVEAVSPSFAPGTWFLSVLQESATPAAGGYRRGSCPFAEAAASHLLNFPTHPRVTARDVDFMVDTVVSAIAALDDTPA